MGYPFELHLDQESAFNSVKMVQRCHDYQVKIVNSGTESHNSLQQGDSYHSMLRRLYDKIRSTTPTMDRHLCLFTAVKVMNDTAEPNGLVTLFLIFGKLPRIPHIPNTNLSPESRHKVMTAERQGLKTEVAKSGIRTSLSRKTLTTHKFRFASGKFFYVCREYKKCWVGLPHLRSADEKAVYVDLGERTGPRIFNLSRVKPAKLPSIQVSFLQQTVDKRSYNHNLLQVKLDK